MELNKHALWLVAEGDYAVLKIEYNGEWVTLIRERMDSPFSHIIEPTGIENELSKAIGLINESGKVPKESFDKLLSRGNKSK